MAVKQNRFEQIARAKKVNALVEHLVRLGVNRDEAIAYDTVRIESLCVDAGVKPPSALAWSQVLDKLAAQMSEQATLFEAPKPKLRRPLWEVAEIVHLLEPYIGCAHEWGGSFRRQADTVGDLDLVVITDGALADAGLSGPLEIDRHDLVQFSRDVELLDETVIQVDVWRCTPAEIGPFMAFVTGPKEWNVMCRSKALSRKWKLSQHGLFDKSGARIDLNTEESIFELLDLPVLTPTERQEWREHMGVKA